MNTDGKDRTTYGNIVTEDVHDLLEPYVSREFVLRIKVRGFASKRDGTRSRLVVYSVNPEKIDEIMGEIGGI